MLLVHIHLVLNHFPIVGTALAIIILFYAFLEGDEKLNRLAILFVIMISIFSVVAFVSGLLAEEVAEKLPWVSEKLIETHEESAIFALIMAGLSGGIGLFILLRKMIAQKYIFALLVFLMVQFLAMAYAGNTGGKIGHQELRSGYTPPAYELEDD